MNEAEEAAAEQPAAIKRELEQQAFGHALSLAIYTAPDEAIADALIRVKASWLCQIRDAHVSN